MRITHHSNRRFRRIIFGALFALTIVTPPLSAQTPSKIRLGTLVPRGSSYYRQLQSMGEEWRKASSGSLSLTIYPDGSQGGDAEMVRRIRQGQLHAGLLTAVGLSQIEPAVGGMQNIPLMFRDLDDVDYINDKMHVMLEDKLAAKGFVVLFWADAGWVRIFSKKPVLDPEDLVPQKVFCWSGEREQFSLMQSLGLRPVSLETNDILPGLRTGLIDAVPMPPFVALAAQVDTSAQHMLELNYAPLIGAAVVKKDVWDKIPAVLQQEMIKASRSAGNAIKIEGRKEAVESVKAMQQRGLSVHKPSQANIRAWEDLLKKTYPKIRGTMVPEDVFDEVRRLLEEKHLRQSSTL